MAMACLPISSSAEWVKVASTLEDAATFYVSTDSIKKIGKHTRTSWELVNYPNGTNEGYKSIKAEQEYDCKSTQLRTLYASTHSELDGKGKTITVAKGLPSPWQTIPENSVATYTKDYVCSIALVSK